MAKKEFGIPVEHALLRKFRDDACPILLAEPFACRRLVQEALDGGDESSIIITRNDEVLIIPGYHYLDIPDIDRGDRQAGRHCLKERYRHLLRIGGQGENIKAAQYRFRRYISREYDAVFYPELMRQSLERVSFDAVSGDHEPHCQGAADHRENPQQSRDVFLRAQRR